MKRSNVAIFVPHRGCPKQCSFCNQKEIIGGSFTGIEPEYMTSLLSAAYGYVSKGLFKGIRISTRPDYISQEILNTLKRFGVTSIELGAQSMSDKVLSLNNRGHSAQDVTDASEMIKSNGFSLGLQMMTGLYGSSDDIDILTAKSLIDLAPDTVRVYPTIVLKNTPLEGLYLSGEYMPQTLDGAVNLCSQLIKLFNDAEIKIIRLGLHDSESLKSDYVAGPYHPAFRELCESRIFLSKIREYVFNDEQNKKFSRYRIEVNPRNISRVVGQKRKNIDELKKDGIEVKLAPNSSMPLSGLTITPIR